jgi:hypothetical protein
MRAASASHDSCVCVQVPLATTADAHRIADAAERQQLKSYVLQVSRLGARNERTQCESQRMNEEAEAAYVAQQRAEALAAQQAQRARRANVQSHSGDDVRGVLGCCANAV